jgi:hypothetical protein
MQIGMDRPYDPKVKDRGNQRANEASDTKQAEQHQRRYHRACGKDDVNPFDA